MRNGIRCRTTVKTWPGRSGRIRAYGSFWCTGVPPIFPRAPILPGNPGVWPGSRPARTTLHHRTRPPGPPARPRLARNGADQTRTVASIVNRQAEWPSAQLAWPVLGVGVARSRGLCVTGPGASAHRGAARGTFVSFAGYVRSLSRWIGVTWSIRCIPVHRIHRRARIHHCNWGVPPTGVAPVATAAFCVGCDLQAHGRMPRSVTVYDSSKRKARAGAHRRRAAIRNGIRHLVPAVTATRRYHVASD
jgi:hypothetical protein